MDQIVISKITAALFGSDTGTVYENCSAIRGVYGVVVVTSGAARYIFADGRQRVLSKGEVALFSDCAEYRLENVSSEPFDHYTVNFSVVSASEAFPEETYFVPKSLAPYVEQCESILYYTHTDNPMRALSVLYALVQDVVENACSRVNSAEKRLDIYPAISYLESEYPSPDITVSSLAALCKMSPTTFRRSFKRITGLSPIEYLLTVRTERAKGLLSHSGLPISEIAVSCGFKDIEYFCRTFKKRVGFTAGRYRAENKE